MAKKQKALKAYYVNIGGSIGIVKAISAEVAKAELLTKLKYERKPWLHGGIVVRPATDEDVVTYKMLANVGQRKRDGRNVIEEELG